MFKIKFSLLIIIGFTALFICCKSNNNNNRKKDKNNSINGLLSERYSKFLKYQPDSMSFPRSYQIKANKIKKVPSKDWVSGFFPGNLWQIFELTQDNRYKEAAKKWTAFVEKEKFNNRTHDVGFKVFCSFGQGLKHENNPTYKKIIVRSVWF